MSGPNMAPYRWVMSARMVRGRRVGGAATDRQRTQGDARGARAQQGRQHRAGAGGTGQGPVVVTLTWAPAPGVDADLSAFLVGADGRVRSDADFVFYNQPAGAGGAVRHLGKQQDGARTVDRAQVDVAALPADVDKVVIGASLDGAGTFGSLGGLAVEVGAPGRGRPPCGARCRRRSRPRWCSPRCTAAAASGRCVPSARATTAGSPAWRATSGVEVDERAGRRCRPAARSGCRPRPRRRRSPAPAMSLEKQRLVRLEKDLERDPRCCSLVKTAGRQPGRSAGSASTPPASPWCSTSRPRCAGSTTRARCSGSPSGCCRSGCASTTTARSTSSCSAPGPPHAGRAAAEGLPRVHRPRAARVPARVRDAVRRRHVGRAAALLRLGRARGRPPHREQRAGVRHVRHRRRARRPRPVPSSR